MPVVRGYACVFNRVIRVEGHAPFVTKRGSYAGHRDRRAELCVDHDRTRPYASTCQASLDLWNDSWGLAFEATVDDDHVIDMVRRGYFVECSALYDNRVGEAGRFNDQDVLSVDSFFTPEISLLTVGACPDTACWMADSPRHHLSEHQRFSANMWQMGASRRRKVDGAFHPRQAARAVAAMPLSTTRIKVPASVNALLDDASMMRSFQQSWADYSQIMRQSDRSARS